MQGLTAAQKEDLVVGLATLVLHDGGVEITVSGTM
jgi:large subunit ribosomal protein LP1